MLEQLLQSFTKRDAAPVGRELLEVEKFKDHLVARIPGGLSDHKARFHLPEALSGLPVSHKLVLDVSQISRLPDEALAIIIQLTKALDSPIVIAGANKHIEENLKFKGVAGRFKFVQSAYEYLDEIGHGNVPEDLAGTEFVVRAIQSTLSRHHREFLRNRREYKVDPVEQSYVEGGKEILKVTDVGGCRVCRLVPSIVNENHGICACFQAAMDKAAKCSAKALVLDVSGAQVVGDAPLGALISSQEILGESVPFYIVGADDKFLAKLNKMRILDRFKIRDSAQTALEEVEAA